MSAPSPARNSPVVLCPPMLQPITKTVRTKRRLMDTVTWSWTNRCADSLALILDPVWTLDLGLRLRHLDSTRRGVASEEFEGRRSTHGKGLESIQVPKIDVRGQVQSLSSSKALGPSSLLPPSLAPAEHTAGREQS